MFILPERELKYLWHELNKCMCSYIAFLKEIPEVSKAAHEDKLRREAWTEGYQSAIAAMEATAIRARDTEGD